MPDYITQRLYTFSAFNCYYCTHSITHINHMYMYGLSLSFSLPLLVPEEITYFAKCRPTFPTLIFSRQSDNVADSSIPATYFHLLIYLLSRDLCIIHLSVFTGRFKGPLYVAYLNKRISVCFPEIFIILLPPQSLRLRENGGVARYYARN